MAEPTHAFPTGSDPMIDSVAGAMAKPIPTPRNSRPAPEAIGQAPGGEEEARKDEDVGVDDPLELAVGGVEGAGERRQGDVQDRVVDPDDEQAEAEDRKDPPAPLVAFRPLHLSSRSRCALHANHLLLTVTFTR